MDPVLDNTPQVRKKEIKALANLLVIKITAVVVLFLAPVLVSVLTFTVYFYIDDDIRYDRVFTALAFMNLIRLPMSSLPNAVSNVSDFLIAIKRLNGFMEEKELQHLSASSSSSSNTLPAGTIRLEHASFTWKDKDEVTIANATGASLEVDKVAPQLTLKDITIHVRPGQLVAVVGLVRFLFNFIFFFLRVKVGLIT